MGMNSLRDNIHKGRLLVIDDDQEVLLLVEKALAPHGYQIVTTPSWPEARQYLQSGHFDLIFSDLQAGEGDGEETVKTLLALGGETGVIIGVSPQRISEGRAALQCGALFYLLQPYDINELQTLIDRSLYRRAERDHHSSLTRENRELRESQEIFRSCLPLLHVDDLDLLGDLVLDLLMESCAAETGRLWLAGAGHSELSLHSRRGLPVVEPDQGERLPQCAETPVEAHLSIDRRALLVPFVANKRRFGLARLESPVGRDIFDNDDLLRIHHVVSFATATLFALQRRQELEYSLLRAPESQAYNMTFFRDHLEKGLYAAKRYDRRLTLIKVVIDNFGELRSRFLDREVRVAVEGVVATVMTVLRDSDLICTILPGQYYLLLPETDSWGALMTQRRIRKALAGKLTISDLKKNLPIRVQMRSATAPLDATTLPELDQLMEARLARLRQSLLLRGHLEDKSFWEITDLLLSPSGAPLSSQTGEGDCAFLALEGEQFAPYALAVCHEILSAMTVRGVLLWGGDDLSLPRSILAPALSGHETRTALFLLGDDATEAPDRLGGVTIPLRDGALHDKAFLLCFGEDYAYALLARRMGDGWHAFHTCDEYFVETMLAKLQDQYQFQAQI